MFDFLKRKSVQSLENKVRELNTEARHFYDAKDDLEERAYYDLLNLSHEKGLTAAAAANTKEGSLILSEIVLNRQYAMYLNEQAIQAYAELRRLRGDQSASLSKEAWFNNVVRPSGGDHIINKEIPFFCKKLIADVESELRSQDTE